MDDAVARLNEAELAELCALADGTLAADRRAALEARVAGSPELAELVARQRRAVAAARALAAEPPPASLLAAVEGRRPAAAARRARLARLVPRLALVGAAAAAIAVAVVHFAGGPGAPTVAEVARLATRPPSGPAPTPAGAGERTSALEVDGVQFPDLGSLGWEAVGARRDAVSGRRAAVVYYAKGTKRVAYVIVPGVSLAMPAGTPERTRGAVGFYSLRAGGGLAVTWRRGGDTCLLVGPGPLAELLDVASWRDGGTIGY